MTDEEIIRKREGIGRQIFEARKQKGISSYKLSTLSGVMRYQISNIENGKISVTVDTLIRIANALEADISI